MDTHKSFQRTLAIDPTNAGFAFIVLEGASRLIDWGVAKIWAKSDREFLARVEAIVDRYGPTVLVAENADESRRGARAQRRIGLLTRYAKSQGMVMRSVSRSTVRQSFGNSRATKQEIATEIARWFPELAPYLPAPRRPWESEDQRINIFDALAFAIASRGPVDKETRAEVGNS